MRSSFNLIYSLIFYSTSIFVDVPFFRMCCDEWWSRFKYVLIAMHFQCHKNSFRSFELWSDGISAREWKRMINQKCFPQHFLSPFFPFLDGNYFSSIFACHKIYVHNIELNAKKRNSIKRRREWTIRVTWAKTLILLYFILFFQLRKPVSTLSIPSMKSGFGNRENNKDTACNEEAGLALVGVRSEYPR